MGVIYVALLSRYCQEYLDAINRPLYRRRVSYRSIVATYRSYQGGCYETRMGLARIRPRCGLRLRSRTPPQLVRRGRHEVCDSQGAQGQAAPRLRSDEGVGGADARLLLRFAGHGVPHAAVARGRGPGQGQGRGRQEGLRDHRPGAQVPGRAQGPGGRHLRSGEGRRGRSAGRRHGRAEPRDRRADAQRVSHRLALQGRHGAPEDQRHPEAGGAGNRRAGAIMSAPDLTRGVRASDAERERIAQLLQRAAAEGRLSPDEAGERLAAATAAVYREDLERLIGDLPVTPERPAAPVGRGPLPVWWVWRLD